MGQSIDEFDRRDPRVPLAAERTLLAWMRTGLAMMGLGFVVARFGLFMREATSVSAADRPAHDPRLTLYAGTALVVIGVIVNVLGAVEHARFIARFNSSRLPPARPVSLSVVIALLLAVIGIGLCAYLLVP